jgi:hypothetical protein
VHPFFGIHLPHLVHRLGRFAFDWRRLGACRLEPGGRKPCLQRPLGGQGDIRKALG